ncbi:MAG: OmpA family protein [Flavobacteriales bacterium]|nr:OmpA family protein [Flavobacteriales bacterium]
MKYFLFLFPLLFISCKTLSQPGIHPEYSVQNKKAIKTYEDILEYYNAYNYEKSIEMLTGLTADYPEFLEAQILLAQVYGETNQMEKAIAPLESAMTQNGNFYTMGWMMLAEIHFSMGHYDEAEKAATQYIKRPNTSKELTQRNQLILASCQYAKEAMKYPVPFDPQSMGAAINSERDEYYPCLTADGNTMLYTRLVADTRVQEGKQEDFFISKKVSGEWTASQSMTEVNTVQNEGAPSLSADGKTVVFTACEWYGDYGNDRTGFGSCDLFFSQLSGGAWSEVKNLGSSVNSPNWESQPSYSADGRSLYFVRGKTGGGEQDIYFSTITPSGKWSSPVKVVGRVNTVANEESVQIHPDGRTLYFSSDGHIGMGGLDIYVSHLMPDGSWGEPKNLGYPINTYKNENSILVTTEGDIALMASDREGGLGGLDLYSFQLHEKVRPDAVTYLRGIVSDALSFKKLDAKVELISLDDGKQRAEAYSDPRTGEYLVCIPSGKDYALNVSKQGYLFHSENFSLKEYLSLKPFELDVELKKLRAGETVVLNNVFFDSNSSVLKPESKVELNRLADLLKSNATVKIEIGGHTDNVGSDTDNMKLSEARAKSVVEFIVTQGIDASRLSSKGYGETTPLESNDTERGRAKNRRTEMKVME